MNEAQRIAYLEAMNIACLYSRRDLPGAAPSRRIVALKRSEPAREAPAQDPASEIKTRLEGPAPHARRPAAPSPAPAATGPDSAAPFDELPVFSLAVTVAGDCLWIDNLPPGRDPGPDYAALIEAICHALALPAGRAEMTLFGFPMPRAPQSGRGVDAARDALQGYLERCLEQHSPRAVILLGDLEQPWFNRQCLAASRVISTVSAWRMLREGALKASAWADLKVLLGDAG